MVRRIKDVPLAKPPRVGFMWSQRGACLPATEPPGSAPRCRVDLREAEDQFLSVELLALHYAVCLRSILAHEPRIAPFFKLLVDAGGAIALMPALAALPY